MKKVVKKTKNHGRGDQPARGFRLALVDPGVVKGPAGVEA